MSKTHEANMWGAKLTLLLTQLSSDRRSGQERKKSRLLLAKNLQTQRNNAWHGHSMDKKMYCVQQQTITCPLNRNKAADTAISKANIADTKAFYGFK